MGLLKQSRSTGLVALTKLGLDFLPGFLLLFAAAVLSAFGRLMRSAGLFDLRQTDSQIHRFYFFLHDSSIIAKMAPNCL